MCSHIKQKELVHELGALYVDWIDFSDHHMIQAKDVNWIKGKSNQLWNKHGVKPVIVVTEKDYDRDQESLRGLHPFDVFILCSRLEFLLRKGHSKVDFKKLVKQLLEMKT
ncbi:putative tetraacyldisaccharide 4'-kinase, mitochondrial [Drosera capensis]